MEQESWFDNDPPPGIFTVCVIPAAYTGTFYRKDLPVILKQLGIDSLRELLCFFAGDKLPEGISVEGGPEVRSFPSLVEAEKILLDGGVKNSCIIVNIADHWQGKEEIIDLQRLLGSFVLKGNMYWCYHGVIVITPEMFSRLIELFLVCSKWVDNIYTRIDGSLYALFCQTPVKISEPESVAEFPEYQEEYVEDLEDEDLCEYCGTWLDDENIRYYHGPNGVIRKYCKMCYDFEHRFDPDATSLW